MATTFDIANWLTTPDVTSAAQAAGLDPKDWFKTEMGKLTPDETNQLLSSVNMAPATFVSQMNTLYDLGLPNTDIMSNTATYNQYLTTLPGGTASSTTPTSTGTPATTTPTGSGATTPAPTTPTTTPAPPPDSPQATGQFDFGQYGAYSLQDVSGYPGVKQLVNKTGWGPGYFLVGTNFYDNPEGTGKPLGALEYDADGEATIYVPDGAGGAFGPKQISTKQVSSIDPAFWDAYPTSVSESEGGLDIDKGKDLLDLIGVDTSKFPTSTTESFSGLDPAIAQQLQNDVYPQLAKSVTDYTTQIDTEMTKALDMYNYQLGRALKEKIPAAINQLSTRGILHGTEAQKILSGIAKEAAMESATKGYEAALNAANKKLAMPAMLSTILGETKYTESSTITTDESKPYDIMSDILGKAQYTSSTTTTTDPSKPYQILAGLLPNMFTG